MALLLFIASRVIASDDPFSTGKTLVSYNFSNSLELMDLAFKSAFVFPFACLTRAPDAIY